MSDQQYIKRGKRYVPVGYADGAWYPVDGIWVVQSKPGMKSSQCVLKIGELSELRPYLDLIIDEQAIIADVNDFAKSKPACSIVELVSVVLKSISKIHNQRKLKT